MNNPVAPETALKAAEKAMIATIESNHDRDCILNRLKEDLQTAHRSDLSLHVLVDVW